MKAILEFTLPEERDEHQEALAGTKYLGILQDLDNELRSTIKYERKVTLQDVRDKLHALMFERGLSLWG